MAEIISMSLSDELLKEMDELQKEFAFQGRSDMIRTALKMLISEKRENKKIKGVIDAVLLVIHDDKYSEEVSVVSHKYQKLVKTQIHNQLENHKCLEVFILNGDGEKITSMLDTLQTNRKIDLVKLVIS
ncbi:MAG: CopG family ribbon-helix-helix protein [Candidatus Aenigmarchaeota archaeon]|nr:CopG family ribbon-helix-helix protein [Candidatus Aenigmarchaeota archaeon]